MLTKSGENELEEKKMNATLSPRSAFEAIRRVLGHTATSDDEALNRLWEEAAGRTTVAVRRWENGGRYHPVELVLIRHGDPLNLSASRDLALLALLRLCGGELELRGEEEDAETVGAPDGECVFRAFLTLRHAGLGEDVAAAALTHLGHTVDVAAIAERVLSWRDCQDFDERRRLHAATRLYGEAPEWEPLPGGECPRPWPR